MASDPVQVSKLEDSAAGRALQAATSAPLTPFVDFASALVTNVFDTLVDNSIKQTRNYADLVASVAGTLEDFQAKTIGDPDKAAVDYLNTVVLPTYGGTDASGGSQITLPTNATTPLTGTITFTKPEVVQVYSGVTATVSVNGTPTESVFALQQGNTIPESDLLVFTKTLLSKQLSPPRNDPLPLVA